MKKAGHKMGKDEGGGGVRAVGGCISEVGGRRESERGSGSYDGEGGKEWKEVGLGMGWEGGRRRQT